MLRNIMTMNRSKIIIKLFSTARRPARSGLLTGVSDPSCSKFYSSELNLENVAAMLEQRSPSAIGLAAKRDWEIGKHTTPLDKNLKQIKLQASDWIAKDNIWDREELMSTLNTLASDTGQFVCLLGGKSTGKTLALNTLSKTQNSVIRIDGRMLTGGSIIESVIAEVVANNLTLQARDAAAQNLPGLLLRALIMQYDLPENTLLTEVMDKIKLPKNQERHADKLANLLRTLVTLYGPITLVMDEANLMFDPQQEGKENVHKVKQYLEVLTALSKQSKQINVILASSEHSFPFKLGDPPLQFNSSNFTKLIFAGEVPPNEMYKLLTNEWGVGPHLAEALLDHYGGHIWDCYNVVGELARVGHEDFEPHVGFGVAAAANVLNVLAYKEGSVEDRKRMKVLLRQLAEHGFAPLTGDPYDDPVARKISAMNVGGVVSMAGTVIGLPRSVWYDKDTGKSYDHGLVPHKQSIRLVIAKQLARM